MDKGKATKYNIAYIDDINMNCDAFKCFFDGHDFNTFVFQSPVIFMENYPKVRLDCIITDVHMPDMDGFKFFTHLTEGPDYNNCPIFFISTDDTESNRIKCLEMGAVDFINRHLSPKEMIIRVRSRIEHHRKHSVITDFGNLTIDSTQFRAWIDKKEINLTFKELKLVAFFVRNYPSVIPKDEIVKAIWIDNKITEGTLYTHLGNLQDKVAEWDYELVTERFKGAFLRKRIQVQDNA